MSVIDCNKEQTEKILKMYFSQKDNRFAYDYLRYFSNIFTLIFIDKIMW